MNNQRTITHVTIQASACDCFWGPEGIIFFYEFEFEGGQQLEQDFSSWSSKIENDFMNNFCNIDWDKIDAEGIELAVRLKKVLGETVYVEYCKSPDDPNYNNKCIEIKL